MVGPEPGVRKSSPHTKKTFDVVRRPEKLLSDDKRVILRYLDFHDPPRIRMIAKRLMRLPDEKVVQLLEQVLVRFAWRHEDIDSVFRENYQQASRHFHWPAEIKKERQMLIGAYLTHEYSIEAAALFNPCIVKHPDQSGLNQGASRFLMSLRATGEGHISSIVFRRGVIYVSGEISFDSPPCCAYAAKPVPDKEFTKQAYLAKLKEMNINEDLVRRIFNELPDPFGVTLLKDAIKHVRRCPDTPRTFKETIPRVLWPAQASYELRFPPDSLPAETVIFPATQYERQGMEDLRLTRFIEEDGTIRYYGTYTAYDGRRIYPMLLETPDFKTFRVSMLIGRCAKGKGMALFPRKIGGDYLMISRHDGQNLYLLKSPNLYNWNNSQKLLAPAEAWELVQIGNCGSPLETEAGWILMTHGVGPMREYSIGVSLLDRQDPSRVIGRLREPLLVPTSEEREGYVPNVVYSCGSMIHNDQLIIPYAVSDSRTGFATVLVADLIGRLLDDGA